MQGRRRLRFVAERVGGVSWREEHNGQRERSTAAKGTSRHQTGARQTAPASDVIPNASAVEKAAAVAMPAATPAGPSHTWKSRATSRAV